MTTTSLSESSTQAPIDQSIPATGHRGVLFSMCLCLVLIVATVSAINLALPSLAVELGASNSSLTWIADAYTVTLAALVLPFGALGDRLGRRNVLVVGTIVFGLAALGASFASSPGVLIGFRVLMGAGAAMVMPGTLSTITASFPADKRSKAVATWAGFASAGAVIGLLAAGTLLEVWSWRSIFIGSACVAVMAGLAAVTLAPNTREAGPHGRFDVIGSVSLAAGIGGLVYSIIEGNESGWTQPLTMLVMAVAAIGFVTYVVAGLHHDDPLLDPRLFARRGFTTGSLTVVVQFMAMFGFFFVGLQYLQVVRGYSPFIAAVALLPVAAVVMPTSRQTPRLVQHAGLRPVMSVGLLSLAAGMFWLSRLDVASGYVHFLIGLLLAGFGIGLTSSTGTSAIVGSLSRDKQGVASAMNDTSREVGSAIGVALMGSVFGTHYRQALPPVPAGTPAKAAEAIQHSAAAGIDIAHRAGTHGAQLADAIRAAFMNGLTASLATVAVILVVATVVVVARAPRRDMPAEDASPRA